MSVVLTFKPEAEALTAAEVVEMGRIPYTTMLSGTTEADRQAWLAYDRAQREYEESLAKRAAMRERYEAMLVQVKAWTPPTSEHQGLKDFMAKQLEESIDFDCGTDCLTVPERLTGAAYKEQRLHSARRNASYHTEHGEADKKRAEERTAWVRALRQSLTESSDTSVEA